MVVNATDPWTDFIVICYHTRDNRMIRQDMYTDKVKSEITRRTMAMKVYVCDVCGWEYDEAKGDPDLGIAPGTKFEDLPADFECPLCGVGKDSFSEK